MSDAPIDQKFRLDLDDTVARIERQLRPKPGSLSLR